MKIKLLLTGFMSLVCLISFSQQKLTGVNNNNPFKITGTVIDSVEHLKLENASIVILNAKDSILQKFCIASPDGSFGLAVPNAGKYILLVSFPDYADYMETFELDSATRIKNFGFLPMTLKIHLLSGVIIKGKPIPVRMKGDTTEYNARAYTIQPNAKVEDLIKQFPGIQVDRNGQITAQGEVVKKVLVDGEEFFGDDPTLVTKNVRADMVDKVQLFDKKSDQATFTGIDDGKHEKTLNIKLKEDKKNGYFGKVSMGLGTDGYYNGQLLFNTFKDKQKFSVYGIFGNDGKTGLGWQDNSKYASSTVEMVEPGVIIDVGGNDQLETFSGRYNGQGIPVVRSGGVHYDNRWDKDVLNINYKIGSLKITGNNENTVQNNLASDAITTVSNQDYMTDLFRQKLNVSYQHTIDSTSNLKVNVEGTLKHVNSNNRYQVTGTGQGDILLNKNVRSLTDAGDQNAISANELYSKKLKNPGQTFSINLLQSVSSNNSTGFVNSRLDFYNNQQTIDSTQFINQMNKNKFKSTILYGNAVYTQPFSKTFFLTLNYGLAITKSTVDKETYDASAPGDYNVFNNVYSNDFVLDRMFNQVGSIFTFNKGGSNLNFGTKLGISDLTENDLFRNNQLKRRFSIWSPQIAYQYRLSQQAAIRLNYWGNSIEPSADQLQPVAVNIDPLFITVGNPLLTPSFNNRVFVAYQSNNVVSGQLIGIFGNFFFNTNPIVNKLTTDENGVSTSEPINLPGKVPTSINVSMFYDHTVKPWEMNMGINLNAVGSTNDNITNNQLDITHSYTYSVHFRASKSKEQKYDFNADFGPSYTVSGSSLQPNLSNNGWGFAGNAGATIYLPGKIQFSTDANYQYYERTETFSQDFSRLILNSALTKTFLKSENLKVALAGNDLLNQNVGFSRNLSGSFINQSKYTTIRRYFMVSLSYDFNKTGKNNLK